MDTLPFGSTGHASSRVIFGAAALAGGSQDFADRTIDLMLAAGVNHFDTAASYGESELRLGERMPEIRDRVFLATKTRERSGADARAELERSLERLQTDRVDLVQLHNLVEEDDWTTAFGANGAVASLFAARDEGLCGAVGVTGHGLRIPAMHLRSLGEADFASVLFPYSHPLLEIERYRADVEELIEACERRGVALQTIKSIAKGRWRDPNARRFSWYEPLEDPGAIGRCVRYVLAQPKLFLNTTSDARKLNLVLDAVNAIGTPSIEELSSDRERFEMSPLFDGGALDRI